jgi:ribosomal-protein-alanine N-acetyltransferase
MGSAADAVIAATARTGLIRSRVGDLPVASAFAPLAATMPVTSAMPSPLYLRAAGAKPQPRNLRNRPAVVREATALEAPLLAELHAECFETPWASEDFARLMAMPGAVSLIASDQDEPLGFALLRRAADEVEILTIGTRPAARRRGVARALIDDQSRFLATQGIVSLFIEVACSNAAAQALYRACGFAETARRMAYYERAGGYREDAIIMRKDIG